MSEIIKNIIKKTVSTVLKESFQTGEWWIDDSGGTIYCDQEVGDQGHQSVVIHLLSHEILSHFGIDDDDSGLLGEHEESIKETLIADGRLSEEEQEEWNMKSPSEIILRKMIEDKMYPSEQQATEALYIAYGGTSSRDPRDYAMEYMKWKIMKSFGSRMEIQTWTLTSGDLQIIVRGLWDIEDDNFGDEEDEKKLINLTVQSKGKVYHGIPLEVLEKKMPAEVIGYRKDLAWMTEGVGDYHLHHKDYRMYEGYKHIVTIFEDNTRLKFEIHYRNARGEDKEKWKRKACSKWKSIASKLHNDTDLTEQGNPIQKSWKECFQEALENPELQPYIRKNPHHQIYGYDGGTAPVADSVNLTTMG